jgi:hypothetical protein
MRGASVPDQALVASPSSRQGVSTEGFDPSRKKHRYALTEAGWIGNTFMFGGSAELSIQFSRWGIIDSGGFTKLGSRLRDTYGRGKAGLPDRRQA